jgi:hypothetical protein
MSVITSFTCTPTRLLILVRLLAGTSSHSLDRSDILEALAPRSLRPGDPETTTVDEIIGEAEKLGIIRLADGRCELLKEVPTRPSRFREWLHRTLTDPKAAHQHGQGEFGRALAWFLMQDPSEALPSRSVDTSDSPAARIGRDFGIQRAETPFELTNNARFQNFAYWARYLGYAWFLDVEARTLYVPDPTEAMKGELAKADDLLKRQVGVREFAGRLGELCPVLETGEVRVEVEDLLPPDKRRSLERAGFSKSTSVALLNLEKTGFLSLASLADSPAVVLESLSGHRPISHVTVRGGHD